MGDGNINLFSRPISVNPDGSKSSIYSTSAQEDGQEILVPGVDEHGKGMLSGDRDEFDKKAMDQYHKTGHYLGKFSGPDAFRSADMLGEFLHHEAQSGLTTPPLATSRKSVNPEHLNQVLLYLLSR